MTDIQNMIFYPIFEAKTKQPMLGSKEQMCWIILNCLCVPRKVHKSNVYKYGIYHSSKVLEHALKVLEYDIRKDVRTLFDGWK